MSKDETASPTVSTEAIMVTAVVDAKEEREVAVVDVPNAFVQTNNEKLEEHHERDIMKIKGSLAMLLVELDPLTYAPYLTEERGVPVIYVEILKAMYGMIKSPLLFYRKLRTDLEQEGFEVNPYDICVANKEVQGKQFTVCWHVDDLKASHVEIARVNDFIAWAEKKYGDPTITQMKPSRGKVHDYLGMTLDFSEKGKVKICMKEYVQKNDRRISLQRRS